MIKSLGFPPLTSFVRRVPLVSGWEDENRGEWMREGWSWWDHADGCPQWHRVQYSEPKAREQKVMTFGSPRWRHLCTPAGSPGKTVERPAPLLSHFTLTLPGAGPPPSSESQPSEACVTLAPAFPRFSRRSIRLKCGRCEGGQVSPPA